jgi:5-formyltetrahydrofolate cyclo-ligase
MNQDTYKYGNEEKMSQKALLKDQQQSLRKASQLAVKELSAAEVLIRSKRIAQNLKGILREKSKICGIFYPMKAEPQVHTLKDEADLHVQFAFPDTHEAESSMDFYIAKKMKKTNLGFFAPDLMDEETTKVIIDTIVVPGLVFHSTGIRIGRGGGFYDRFLSSFQGLRIGVCFEEQVLVDPWEMQTWDEKVHYVVTENRVIDCQRSGE